MWRHMLFLRKLCWYQNWSLLFTTKGFICAVSKSLSILGKNFSRTYLVTFFFQWIGFDIMQIVTYFANPIFWRKKRNLLKLPRECWVCFKRTFKLFSSKHWVYFFLTCAIVNLLSVNTMLLLLVSYVNFMILLINQINKRNTRYFCSCRLNAFSDIYLSDKGVNAEFPHAEFNDKLRTLQMPYVPFSKYLDILPYFSYSNWQKWQLVQTLIKLLLLGIHHLLRFNPGPAEPRYVLPLKTV